jgi:tRNA(Ile)-lysidine synthase
MVYKGTDGNLLNAFQAYLQKTKLLETHETTLLAVSAGVDSMVMCSLFYRTQLKFAIAHCNFTLRGSEAAEAEELVYQLSQQYQVPCYSKKFATFTYAQKHGLSIQMAARQLRYAWFEELRSQHNLQWIATAHHQDDVLETLLLNLTKGTSLAGLHGILPRKGHIIRPLLFTNKNSLLQYAQQEKLFWLEDSSNAKNTYQRNLIRNKVIPILKSINPNLHHTTQLTVERLSQIELLFQKQLKDMKQLLFHTHKDMHEIMLQPLQAQPAAPVILWELLRPFGFNFPQIKNLLTGKTQSGKLIYSSGYTLYVDRSKWIIKPRSTTLQTPYSIAKPNLESIKIADYTLTMHITPREQYIIKPNPHIAALDLSCLIFPLTIRPWQSGDFFYPLGMKKRKKVSDFLVDLKIPRAYKNQIYLLISDNQVAWIMGYRIDNRFKLKHTTEKVYELSLVADSSLPTPANNLTP